MTGARISFAALKPDGTGDKAEVFAEGWLRQDGSYAGRPTYVAELPDGSLLIADDEAGALYRITYEGNGSPSN
jgi:glucose/arabinose dehydrogenase